MPRKSKAERALDRALDDAAKSGIEIHEAKLIQARITALSKLVERELDTTVAWLTNELSRVTEDNRRMAALSVHPSTKPQQLREIDELVQKYREGNKV